MYRRLADTGQPGKQRQLRKVGYEKMNGRGKDTLSGRSAGRGAIGGLSLAAVLAAAALAGASSAGAAVTVGQIAPTTPTPTCASPVDRVQPLVTSGNTYVVPVEGTITSWSTNAGAAAGASLKLKVFRPVLGVANTYTVEGNDGPRALTPNTVNSFPANVPVKKGDLIGLNSNVGSPNCSFVVTGDQYFRTTAASDTADGATATIATPVVNRRLNITATVAPSNTLVFDKPSLNRKKGFVNLSFTVPNPGELDYSGKKVKVNGPSTVTTPGVVTVRVVAQGKKKKNLKKNGKVKVKPFFTFTPTDGIANTQSQKLILKKKKKKNE